MHDETTIKVPIVPNIKGGKRLGANLPVWLGMTAFEVISCVSLALAATAAVFDRTPLTTSKALIAAALVSALAAARLALRRQLEDKIAAEAERSEQLQRQIEQLNDTHWKMADNEARLRDLLDTQEDLIVRRDGTRNVVFANRAFCRQFGVTLTGIAGQRFEPIVLEGPPLVALTTDGDRRRECFVALTATQTGPRWIAWEEQLVASHDNGYEIQSSGRDVTAERASDLALREARTQAETSNRAKSRFLAAMSHEIRTPMNGILGMSSLLQDTPLTAEQQTYTSAIDQSARALLALIDEILDFSKIEAGKVELARAPFSLRQCIQSSVELLAPSAYAKGLELAWQIGRDVPQAVLGDEARVRQIVLNLVSNAIKFTDRGGVDVRVFPAGAPGAIAISVKDTGIGLSPGDMARLFDEFERAEAALHRREGGTGLGLAISKRLAKAMHGDITVEGKPGDGATFTAVLNLEVCARNEDDALMTATPPELRAGGCVLLAVNRTLERNAMASVLEASDISVCQASFEDATATVMRLGAGGRFFSHIITEAEHGIERCRALIETAQRLQPGQPVEGTVLVSVLSRAGFGAFKGAGYGSCLVRPVRPEALLQQVRGGSKPAATIGGSPEAYGHNPAGRAYPNRKIRVLVAEDNEINALLARRVIEKAGCEAVIASNGHTAVAIIAATLKSGGEPVDVILMDVFMPGLDGFAATEAIHTLFAEAGGNSYPKPPIIALTANAFAEDRARCLEAGMSDYLAKPFDAAQLKTMLGKWVGDRFPPQRQGSQNPAA